MVGRRVMHHLQFGAHREVAEQHAGAGFLDWASALRLHQWSKNTLILVPLLLSQQFADARALALVVATFLIFGLIASATYLINDLIDVAADRTHPTKRRRPIAAGSLRSGTAATVACILLLGGLLATSWLPPGALQVCLAYVVITFAYSLGLKRVPLLDTFVIGGLFTLRVTLGLAVLDQPLSTWLLSFALFFFLSLALAKRHAEIMMFAQDLPARGYQAGDWPVTLGFGVASATIAVTIMLLYLRFDAAPQGLYSDPQFLYLVPCAMLLWTMRIWLHAHRGKLRDDPIIFALTDRVSWLLGGGVGVAWSLAALA